MEMSEIRELQALLAIRHVEASQAGLATHPRNSDISLAGSYAEHVASCEENVVSKYDKSTDEREEKRAKEEAVRCRD